MRGLLPIISHDHRRILHVNVTTSPSAQWTAQQVVEAFRSRGCPDASNDVIKIQPLELAITGRKN